jgi:hypothetical protein
MAATGARISAPKGSNETPTTFLNELREPLGAAEPDVTFLLERMEQLRPFSP